MNRLRAMVAIAFTSSCGGWDQLYVDCVDAGRCSEASGGGTAGGSMAGGSTAGGSMAGGSTAGGSTAGGSTGGGSSAGGSTAGGSTAGGSTAGGSTSGGSSGGGSTGGGTAGGSPAPVILVWSPPAWDAGVAEPGSSVTQQFTLTNTGVMQSPEVTVTIGTPPMGFSFDSNDCDLRTLQPNGSCTVTVRFAPAAPGSFAVNLRAQALAVPTALATMTGRSFLAPVHVSVRTDGGTGSGSIAIESAGSSFTCPADCELDFPRGGTVTFSATETQSSFSGFSGCSALSDGGCTTTLTSDAGARVVATFARWPRLTLSYSAPADAGYELGLNSSLGLQCPATSCSTLVRPGTGFDVTTESLRFARVTNWSGCPGADGGRCSMGMPSTDTNVAVTFSLLNRAFLSPPLPMNLGGIAPYTTACRAFAADAGLPGNWIAWMSLDAGIDPRGTATNTRGWVLTDSRPFLDQIQPRGFYPLLTNHLGVDQLNSIGSVSFTVPAGTLQSRGDPTCSGYTEATGQFVGGRPGGTQWSGGTSNITGPCSMPTSILCFQNDWSTVLAAPGVPPGGKIAYVSSVDVPSTEMARDDICNATGTQFGNRTFRPLRARPGQSAWAALNTTSAGPWYRPDGVVVATAANLEDAGVAFQAPLLQFADGGYMNFFGVVWVGARAPGIAGSNTTTCTNWVNDAGVNEGSQGNAFDALFSFATQWRCDGRAHYYCFEQ